MKIQKPFLIISETLLIIATDFANSKIKSKDEQVVYTESKVPGITKKT